MPGEEVQDRVCEDVVAVAGDHVTCAADIDELDLGEAGKELVGAFLADEVTHLAAHEQHGYLVREDRFHRRVHPIDIGHLEWAEAMRCH